MTADDRNRAVPGAQPSSPAASCPPGRPPSPADAARAHEAGRTVSASDYRSGTGSTSGNVVNAGSAPRPSAQAAAGKVSGSPGAASASSYTSPSPSASTSATGSSRPGAARSVWVEDTGPSPNAGPRFSAADAGPNPADAFKEAMSKVGEIKEYASYFVSAKVDSVKGSVRNVIVYAALGVLGLLVGGAVLITAAVLLLTGLAGAINAIFYNAQHPDRWQWVGALVVSLLVLGGTVAGVMIGLKKVTGGSRKSTVKKYESRQRVQREQFGHDVHDRAAEQQVRAAAESGAVRRNGHA